VRCWSEEKKDFAYRMAEVQPRSHHGTHGYHLRRALSSVKNHPLQSVTGLVHFTIVSPSNCSRPSARDGRPVRLPTQLNSRKSGNLRVKRRNLIRCHAFNDLRDQQRPSRIEKPRLPPFVRSLSSTSRPTGSGLSSGNGQTEATFRPLRWPQNALQRRSSRR